MKKVKLVILSKFKFPFQGKTLSGKLVLLMEKAGHKDIRNSTTEMYIPGNEEHLQEYKNFIVHQSRGKIAAIGENDVEGGAKPVWDPKKGIILVGGLICLPSSEYWEEGTIFLLVKKAA